MVISITTRDLMDRSRITAAIGDLAVERDVVVVDLATHGAQVAALRAQHPDARIVCYGPHVDDEAAASARAAGADSVMPRSRFFRDPAAAIAAIGH